jgi:uncharacterized protein GlcG (DUF336 family)
MLGVQRWHVLQIIVIEACPSRGGTSLPSVVPLSHGEQVRSTRCLARIISVMGYDGSEVITGSDEWRVRKWGGNNAVITLEAAKGIVSAAEHKAQEMGLPMNIAVMDAGRNLVAFHRMDGAWVASIDIAIDKAFTSAGRGLTTRKIGEMAQPGEPLFGINTTNGGRIVIFAGGIPLTRDGEVVGAIGVSGGTVDEDHEVAEVGVSAFS